MKAAVIFVLVVFAIMLIVFGVFGSICFMHGTNTTFTDTVAFVMMLVGLLVALASIGIWTALRNILGMQIHHEISKAEEEMRRKSLTRMAAKVADAYWYFYASSKNKMFLEKAIEIVNDARSMAEGKLSERDWEEEKCRIYNNLAYGYAVRGDKKDTAVAHYLIEYVKERAEAVPEKEAEWLDTYAYVLYRLPKDPKQDKYRALEIANSLIQRPDISDVLKKGIKSRYKI